MGQKNWRLGKAIRRKEKQELKNIGQGTSGMAANSWDGQANPV
jgi:hypothetical protein